MPSRRLILWGPLLLSPIPPSIRVFSNESTLHIRWPKHWCFSFSIISSKEYKLNKQGDIIQPWRTPFPIWNQSVVPCPVLTIASWPAYRFLKRQVRWSGILINILLAFVLFVFFEFYAIILTNFFSGWLKHDHLEVILILFKIMHSILKWEFYFNNRQ